MFFAKCLPSLPGMPRYFNDLVNNHTYKQHITSHMVIYRGHVIFIYIFCQVYSTRYVDQMGIIGYFPATMVKETHTFVQDTVNIPATVSGFFLHFLV